MGSDVTPIKGDVTPIKGDATPIEERRNADGYRRVQTV